MSKHPTLFMILATIGLLAVIVVAILIVYAAWPQTPRQVRGYINYLINIFNPISEEDVRGTVLVEAWASDTDTFLMDVPELCAAQRLDYSGWQRDSNLPASLEFAVSQLNNEIQSTNIKINDIAQGVEDWTLADNEVYALIVRGTNARWRFVVTCQ